METFLLAISMLNDRLNLNIQPTVSIARGFSLIMLTTLMKLPVLLI
jgi:hypothetical protein